MTRICAVDFSAGKALFDVNGSSVVVDINKLDVDAADTALTAAAWMKVAHDFEYPGVWSELAEAAVTQLQVETTTPEPEAPRERKFRVPQAVKDEAQQSLGWVRGFERGSSAIGTRMANSLIKEKYLPYSKIERIAKYFSNRPATIAENAGFTPGSQGYPTNERIRYGLWGGESAREWSTKVVDKHRTLTAAAPAIEDDGNNPHAYVDDPDHPGECVTCGRPAEHEIHTIVASAFEYEEECDYFGHGLDPNETLVDDLYIRRPDGSWAHRVEAEWQDMEEPGEDEVIIMLDKESAYHLADILDDKAPQDPSILPFELTMINPTEAALVNAAEAEIDWDFIQRVYDIYDSQERSVNAKKQVRAPGGRFGDMPDDPSSKSDPAKETKARLSEALPLVPDINARIQQYLAEVAEQRGSVADDAEGEDTAADGPLTAAAINRLLEFAEADPATVTDVRPLYLAIVDEVDTEAVLDVISLVPNGNDVVAWKRDKGTWQPADDILADLRGVTPPPVVELSDEGILENVLEQVDKATGGDDEEPDNGPVSDSQNPDGTPAGAKPDANPDQHPIPASGFTHPEIDMLSGTDSVPHRDKYAKKGYSLPDGSFPIPDVAHLKKAIKAHGRAKNKAAAKKHITKRARALKRTDLLPEGWNKDYVADTFSMWGPNGEIMNLAEGGADRNRGNAEQLRHYWVKGEGAAKVGWNTPGDWTRCVSHLSKYLGSRAKGYCTLRHKEATGSWPGQENN